MKTIVDFWLDASSTKTTAVKS